MFPCYFRRMVLSNHAIVTSTWKFQSQNHKHALGSANTDPPRNCRTIRDFHFPIPSKGNTKLEFVRNCIKTRKSNPCYISTKRIYINSPPYHYIYTNK